jgi:hypothetical protein
MSNIPEARERVQDIAAHLEYLAGAEKRLLTYLKRYKSKEHYLIWMATRHAFLLGGLHEQLLELLPAMTRERTAPTAPRTSRRVSAELKREMAQEKLDNPKVPMREIAERHGVDGGRVSEGVKALRSVK